MFAFFSSLFSNKMKEQSSVFYLCSVRFNFFSITFIYTVYTIAASHYVMEELCLIKS